MNKSLCALSLLVASSLCGISGANALETQNGSDLNGLAFNGLAFNGSNLNGLAFNGLAFNGSDLNGTSREGGAAGTDTQAATIILKDGSRVVLK